MKIKFIQLTILMSITMEFFPGDAFEHNMGSMLMKNFIATSVSPSGHVSHTISQYDLNDIILLDDNTVDPHQPKNRVSKAQASQPREELQVSPTCPNLHISADNEAGKVRSVKYPHRFYVAFQNAATTVPMNKINKKSHDKIQKAKTEPRSCDV